MFLSFALGVSCQHYTTLRRCNACVPFALHYLLMPTLHYITPHYVCSRLQPLLTTLFTCLLPYLNIVRTDYILNLNAQPTVCNRFTLFACVLMDYIGGEPPYLPPKPIALPSKIIIYISEKIFFEKK